MYKVLIADDEAIIREGLVSSIAWERLGLVLVGVACDGQEAINKAREFRPDICLVDIKMPVLSGLDFLKELKTASPDALGIIISGYDTFSFAQQAIQYGAFDYLLKPVDEEALEKSLIAAMNKISSRNKYEMYVRSINSDLKELYPEAKRRLIYNAVHGTSPEPDSGDRRKSVLKSFKKNVFVLLISKRGFRFSGQDDKRLSESELLTRLYDICIQESKKGYGIVFEELVSSGILIVAEADAEDEFEGIINKLKSVIFEKTWYKVEIFGSMGKMDTERLREMTETVLKESEMSQYFSPTIRKIKDYIDKHFTDNSLSLTGIASATQMSESYLSRRFKMEMGFSYTKYIEMKRMELAEKLLNEEDYRICEIAEKTGYANQHYFCTAFKRVKGCNPSDYLKKKKNETQ